MKRFPLLWVPLACCLVVLTAKAQAPQASSPGQVLFSRGTAASDDSGTLPDPQPLGTSDPLGVTDAERSALTFTAYDLDVQVTPATAALSVRAGLRVRNEGTEPLKRIVLQISSTLRWQAVSAAGRALPAVTRLINTDADHTGAMDEAVVTLAQPLAPGAEAELVALYAGAVKFSAERLERTGAPAVQAEATDWDVVGEQGTLLRGFGYVMWYPVASPPVFFRDADRLFATVGAMRRRSSESQIKLRLAVEYHGEPPYEAFFSGRDEMLRPISDTPDAPAAQASGIATAEFPAGRLGFRTLDLVITSKPSVLADTPQDPDLISLTTEKDSAQAACLSAAARVTPLLHAWLGTHPNSQIHVIDHAGQPFEDETMLVRPVQSAGAPSLEESFAHTLTHAWVRSRHPWISEGAAEFARLLWIEQTQGRNAALNVLQQGARTLSEAETQASSLHGADPSSSSSSSVTPRRRGPSLVEADREVFYRTKAAAVWWMLRGIVGDQALQKGIQAYCADPAADRDVQGFERVLETSSHKDLRWFFNDWVYENAGLPRLSIASVTPSQLSGRTGLPDGWLIAVEVRNEGEASAEVPVTIHSAGATQTQRLRIAGHSSSSVRIVFPGTPEEVVVNDGSVPEAGPAVHRRQLGLTAH